MRLKWFLSVLFIFQIFIGSAQPVTQDKVVELSGGISIEFVYIPAGEFIMGSKEDETGRQSDESPIRKMRITKGFYLSKYEVTQKLWSLVMEDNPAVFRTLPDSENRPVESVSWNECQTFLGKLNNLSLGTFRLPTEAEWEYACRAGTTTKYYWGDLMSKSGKSDFTWANSRSLAMTHPVGKKKPNAWGLYDMSGNVWEWCSDWYGPYEPAELVDSKGPKEGNMKVFRGGSWYDFFDAHRSANRHKHAPNEKYSAIGLRLVLEK